MIFLIETSLFCKHLYISGDVPTRSVYMPLLHYDSFHARTPWMSFPWVLWPAATSFKTQGEMYWCWALRQPVITNPDSTSFSVQGHQWVGVACTHALVLAEHTRTVWLDMHNACHCAMQGILWLVFANSVIICISNLCLIQAETICNEIQLALVRYSQMQQDDSRKVCDYMWFCMV